MSETAGGPRAAGWMYADGDPPGTVRYWNGQAWQGDPQPVGPPAQVPAQPQPQPTSTGWSGTKKTVVAFTVVAVLVGGLMWWSFSASQAQAAVANDFMSALAANDYDTAAALLADECGQPEDRTAAALRRDFADFDIVAFELEVGTVGLTNSDQTGVMVGTVTEAGGRSFPVELSMLKRGDWKVCTFVGSG